MTKENNLTKKELRKILLEEYGKENRKIISEFLKSNKFKKLMKGGGGDGNNNNGNNNNCNDNNCNDNNSNENNDNYNDSDDELNNKNMNNNNNTNTKEPSTPRNFTVQMVGGS